MKILYISNENYMNPAGGVATYLSYMASAMKSQGHSVYLFCWDKNQTLLNDHNLWDGIYVSDVNKNQFYATDIRGYRHELSHNLKDEILSMTKFWNIDVIESTDYLSPATLAFEKLRNNNSKVICSTYNHGTIEEFYQADKFSYSIDTQIDLQMERRQLNSGHIIISPSNFAKNSILKYGTINEEKIKVIREPYEFRKFKKLELSDINEKIDINYHGRISISKGLSRTGLLINQLNNIIGIDNILMIGSVINTPFKKSDAKEYLLSKIPKELKEKINFIGRHDRETSLSLLQESSIAPHFGVADTFSYAFIEALDNGLIPLTMDDTAMVEFYPEHLKDYILKTRGAISSDYQDKIEKTLANSQQLRKELYDYNHKVLNPNYVAKQMTELYEENIYKIRGNVSVTNKKYTCKDITVLIPTHNPDNKIIETIESIINQKTKIQNVIICNDGSNNSFNFRILKAYYQPFIDNIQIINQPNTGLLGARNSLIKHCKTKWAIFLDDDDMLHEDFVSKTLNIVNNNQTNAVITGRQNFMESREAILRSHLNDHIHCLSNDYRMTGLIDINCLKDIQFDITVRDGEGDDWIFWKEFSNKGYHMTFCPELLFYYRFATGSMSWPFSKGQEIGTHVELSKIKSTNKIENQAIRSLKSNI